MSVGACKCVNIEALPAANKYNDVNLCLTIAYPNTLRMLNQLERVFIVILSTFQLWRYVIL